MITDYNYKNGRFLRCLKRIFSTALGNGNTPVFIAFLLSVPLYLISQYIEVQNVEYQINVFKREKGATLKEYFFRTVIELVLHLTASIISDISQLEFIFRGYETSLTDFFKLKWNRFHAFSLGDLLEMQYEKARTPSKFLSEIFISIIVNIFKTFTLISVITKDTHIAIGGGLIFGAFLHVFMFFGFLKTYNYLQMKYLNSQNQSRTLVENESKNFEVIKTYGIGDISTKRVAIGQEERRISKMHHSAYDARSNLVYKSFEICSITFVYIFYFKGIILQQTLNAVSKQVVMLYEAMRDLLTALGKARDNLNAFYILDESTLIDKYTSSTSDSLDDFIVLECDNLSFKDSFNGVSIRILRNEKIAVVGKNCSGKSSLLRMVSGLYEPEGLITIDYIDINRKHLHNLITFISQDDAFTHGSIMKNLQYGNNLTQKQIIESCKIFNVDNVFNNLDGGYYKFSTTGGTDISGGQKQRVNFMRGVLRDTPILIVDDCLSGVNTIDKHFLIDKLLSSNNRTIIMTCDRFDNLKRFDQIILLDKNVSKVGNFKELENDLRIHFDIFE